MSFSVQTPTQRGPLEWAGTDLNGVFAQRGNLLRPRFWRMLSELLRFNRLCTALAESGADGALSQPLGAWLDEQRFTREFRDWYLLPMLGCIWSCPTEQMQQFPLATMIRFCHNHGLIRITGRPRWRTVRGGSRSYATKIIAALDDARSATPVRRVQRLGGGGPEEAGSAGELVSTERGSEHFDDVVLACHSDQALTLLGDPSRAERRVLGAIGYQYNRALLHTDVTLLPKSRRAWAAWNYQRAAPQAEGAGVCLHYLLNKLQPLPFRTPLIVSLNPQVEPKRGTVLGEFDYAHPVFDLRAIEAQRGLGEMQGRSRTWYCGAWTGYGFHEDGLRSGEQVAAALLASPARHAVAQAA
jgi:predicted NAD/FAD-binding protein